MNTYIATHTQPFGAAHEGKQLVYVEAVVAPDDTTAREFLGRKYAGFKPEAWTVQCVDPAKPGLGTIAAYIKG